jgi:hypothetical protein
VHATPPTSSSTGSSPAFPDEPQLIQLGWCEWVQLPGVTPSVLRAKCDTGATGSALHAESIEVLNHGEFSTARFNIFPGEELVELRLVGKRMVKSSNGDAQARPVVILPVHLAGITYAIECTLTDRTPMAYPMLLGRSALAGRFLVNPARARVHRKPRRGRP